MSSKRKREDDDIEFTPSAKIVKPTAEEVTRSGRVRKKPARFKDTEADLEDDEAESNDNPKLTPTKAAASIATLTPKVPTTPVPVTKTLPAVIAKVLASPAPDAAVASQPVRVLPQTAKALLQAKLMEMPKATVIPPMPPPSHGSPAVTVIPPMPPPSHGNPAATVIPPMPPPSHGNAAATVIPPMPPPSHGSPAATAKIVPIQLNPQAIHLPTLMVKTVLAAAEPVSPTAESPDANTPKSGRVRKKSAKVLEMEAFEEAERAKHNVKKGAVKPVTSPTTTTPPKLTNIKPEDVQQRVIMQQNLPVAGVTSPVKAEPMESAVNTVTVQQALLQLPVMKTDRTLAKNTQVSPKLTASAKKAKKKKSEVVVTDPAVPTIPQISTVPKSRLKSSEVTIAGLRSDADPMLSTSYLPDSSAHLMVKEEPGEGVDLGLLSSEAHEVNMSVLQKQNVVKQEPVTPAKKTKSKAKKAVTPDPALDQTNVDLQDGAANKASSVIKMLLSKPSQYTGPSVSTKTITTDKKSKQKKATVETELTVDTAVKEEPGFMGQESELKSKLMLSPNDDMDEDLPYDEEMYTEDDFSPESKGKKKVKKIKKKPKQKQPEDMEDDSIDGSVDWEFETADGNLVIAEDIKKTKPKKSPTKSKPGGASSEGHIDSNKKGKKSSPTSAEKKKKRLTAYTMWCNTVRTKVLNDNPGMDFAQLSRRLGEIWQGLPSKDKMNWKRKAKREARKLLGKGLLITTGKGKNGGGPAVVNQMLNKPHITAPSGGQTTYLQPQQKQMAAKALTFTKPDDSVIASPTKSGLGTEPVDVAAHLKLLGESLSIIGMRLQEHRGLIAVQGSLSVLLDSLLCAVGPLMCLTLQVSEMNGCSPETHARTLDHVAYIMPGL